jgi:hypothetical protein
MASDFTMRVLDIFADIDAHSELFWRAEGDEMRFFVICNDVFAWALADAEPLTPENIHVLEGALADLRAIREGAEDEAPLLFCARSKGLRPQGAMYAHIAPDCWALFDACGPPRAVGFGNPRPHPTPTAGGADG